MLDVTDLFFIYLCKKKKHMKLSLQIILLQVILKILLEM